MAVRAAPVGGAPSGIRRCAEVTAITVTGGHAQLARGGAARARAAAPSSGPRPPAPASGVASDPSTMTANDGRHAPGGRLGEQRAGPAGRARRPSTVISTARPDSPPPIISPAAAPTGVSPRHQIPSTSSGQNVDAATANARPTTVDSPASRPAAPAAAARPRPPWPSGGSRGPSRARRTSGRTRRWTAPRRPRPAARWRWTGRRRTRRRRPARRAAAPGSPPSGDARQHQHDRVGVAVSQQVRARRPGRARRTAVGNR